MNGMIIGGGRGGTFERIDTRSTFLGILIPPALMIGIKFLVLIIFVAAVVFIGEIAGPALLAGGFLYQLMRPHDYENRKKLWLVFWIGATITFFVHVVQSWPLLVMWLWFPDQGFLISWLGEPFIRASAELVILRWTIGFILPWMLWWPYQWSMWTLMAELIVPKARETPFNRIDIESIPQPDGWRMRSQRMRAQETDPDAHIPAMAGGGGPEIVGE